MGNLNDGTLRLDPHWRGQDWRLWGRNAVIHDGLVKMKSAAKARCPKVWARWPDPEVALFAPCKHESARRWAPLGYTQIAVPKVIRIPSSS